MLVNNNADGTDTLKVSLKDLNDLLKLKGFQVELKNVIDVSILKDGDKQILKIKGE